MDGNKMQDAITRAFAIIVTCLAVGMAIVSAWQRADTDTNRLLLAGLSAVIVAAVHLLPALLGRFSRLAVWPVWFLCFLAALWGHIWFFASATHGAAEGRAASSIQAKAVQDQRTDIEAELAANKARSAATVAGILAKTQDAQARAALEIELAQGKRANDLRARLTAISDQGATVAATDPVVARVTAVTGLPIEALNIWSGILIAMLLEVLGSLLWVAAMADTSRQKANWGTDADMIERLYAALENSEISPTTEDICKFIGGGCSHDVANRLLRDLEARMKR